MPGFDPNEPRDKQGKWTTAGSSVNTLALSDNIKNKISNSIDKESNPTDNEEKALENYTSSSGYFPVNLKLRTNGELDTQQKEMVRLMDSVMDKLTPAFLSKPLYRGLQFATNPTANRVLSSMNVGNVIVDRAYMSASSDKRQAEIFQGANEGVPSVIFTIHNPMSARSVERYSNNPQEKEYLFKRNSKFRINSKTYDASNNSYNVDVTEIK